ncbi:MULTISPECIES: AbrB/MazE/SpoVT family DNA-binding domain-containing protein [Oceanobacillus]|uniref:AbrB/MazE/SpoVT family DNA-binding domain-containing protein n=2 Tax=Oceanobacillus TaxID=182709 RepID=A0AAW5B5E0_9BACI|nr:AbrB/MazE/SpoVT family DNA-binding domain-containing protein [Oceanobacillus jordanicus]MCG3419724.1 AbrB/MazE/SpoVT family DNA-binding domain-containing protein [Oceanobacillus jordanicus]
MKCETITLPNKRDQLTNTGIICKLNKRMTITIPKKIRKRLSLMAGDEVAISMIAKSNELIIRKVIEDTLDNKMIINEKGAIRIPIELRRFLSLENGDLFLLNLKDHGPFISLKKLSK